MSGVYTNIVKKRIEQSQEASQAPSKAIDPQESHSSISQVENQSESQYKHLQKNSTITSPSSNTLLKKDDTMIPRHHDTVVSLNHDTTTPQDDYNIFELVRKSVKQIGKEAATHRFTLEEKNELADIEYTYKRQGIRTSENEITRIAINYLTLFTCHSQNVLLMKSNR
jgi:hypothetical protein